MTNDLDYYGSTCFVASAYHEAGHAVAAHILGFYLDGIDLRLDLDSGGRAMIRAWVGEAPREPIWIDRLAIVSWAGLVGEWLVTAHDPWELRHLHDGDDGDWGRIQQLTDARHQCPARRAGYPRRMLDKTQMMFVHRPTYFRPTVLKLAELLRLRIVLTGPEAIAIIDEHATPRRARKRSGESVQA